MAISFKHTAWVSLIVATLAAGGGHTRDRVASYVAVDEVGGVIATIQMKRPLPLQDTSFEFTGPDAKGRPATIVLPMTFEVAGQFQCHWSALIVICSTDAVNPAPARTQEGREIRRINESIILVANSPGDLSGDFATYKDGQLVAFGVRDDAGNEPWRYDLR